MEVWVAIVGIVVTGVAQLVAIAFFLGKLHGDVETLKKNPVVNYDARFVAIETTIKNFEQFFTKMEKAMEDRFGELEHTVRNLLSGKYGDRRDPR